MKEKIKHAFKLFEEEKAVELSEYLNDNDDVRIRFNYVMYKIVGTEKYKEIMEIDDEIVEIDDGV